MTRPPAPSTIEGVLAAMRDLDRRGAFAEEARLADALPPALRASPGVALERARARMRQGRIRQARGALAEADLAGAAPGERLAIALEAAMLRVLGDAAVREALADAGAALAAAGDAVRGSDRAEAERVHARLLLTAATYYEVPAGEGRRARDRLPALAETLERAGRVDEALAALLTRAQRLDGAEERLDALAEAAARAVAAGRPGVAGEALLLQAGELLAGGAAGDRVRDELDAAEARFAEADHVHGPVDARVLRARLETERGLGGPEALEECLREYRRIDHPRGALSVLMDLSQLAHERGDTAAAARHRREVMALADEVGMGLARDGFQTAQADLLMRAGDYGAAIELCRAAVAAGPPAFSAAGYEQLASSAYSFVGELDAAVAHARRALAGYLAVGAEDPASTAALALASHLDSYRREEAWDEAAALLREWTARDERRGAAAAAVQKREMTVQVLVSRFVASPARRGDPALLDQAEAEVAAAEALATGLPGREAARRAGGLAQLRAQLANLRGDPEAMEASLRAGLATYEAAGLAMEAANCRYLIGVNRLVLAGADLLAHFGEAERALRGALAYYDEAGMRTQAADTRFMFARLYASAAPRAGSETGGRLLDAALGHLAGAEDDYDAVRRAYTAGSVLEAQRVKRTIAGKSRRIFDLALEILLGYGGAPEAVWGWTQRAKARALADALGAGAAPPGRVLAALEARPESLARVAEERELAARTERAPAAELPALRAEMAALRERMAADPGLAEYLELRTGAAPEADDLRDLLGSEAAAGRPVVCVDWVAAGERLFLVALRPGEAPRVVPLPLKVGEVRAFVAGHLGAAGFRHTLRDAPELLGAMDPLVAPLLELSAPEELLVLSPTGPLHAVPLHALDAGGEPLLARNPAVYTPSLGVLRHCLARRGSAGPAPTAALLGDPSGDREEAARLVEELGHRFGTEPLTRGAVTRAAFAEVVAGRDVVHFQGHAVHDPGEPLDSRLELADGPFTAREVFALREVRAGLVTLAACESAAAVIAVGDEPLGLIPAFLYAGAGAVLATQWRVHRAPAAAAMRHFYGALAGWGGAADRAQALREALLAVRATPGWETPYHWAPFVLHGDWH